MLVLTIVKTKTEYPDLPMQITAAREKAKLSKAKCAELCGVSRQYWSQLESNRLEVVSSDLIREIEAVLDTKFL